MHNECYAADPMARVLLAWLGNTDLKAAAGELVGDGPIAQALQARQFDQLVLLDDQKAGLGEGYAAWVRKKCGTAIHLRRG